MKNRRRLTNPASYIIVALAAVLLLGYWQDQRHRRLMESEAQSLERIAVQDSIIVAAADSAKALQIRIDDLQATVDALTIASVQLRHDARQAAVAARNAEAFVEHAGPDTLLAARATNALRLRTGQVGAGFAVLPDGFLATRSALSDYITLATITLPAYRVATIRAGASAVVDSMTIAALRLQTGVYRQQNVFQGQQLSAERVRADEFEGLAASFRSAYMRERRFRKLTVATGAAVIVAVLILK